MTEGDAKPERKMVNPDLRKGHAQVPHCALSLPKNPPNPRFLLLPHPLEPLSKNCPDPQQAQLAPVLSKGSAVSEWTSLYWLSTSSM